jgi:hypothetical protein
MTRRAAAIAHYKRGSEEVSAGDQVKGAST